MASLTFESVEKRFGDVTAVRDLSMLIADGEFVVLLGPSGCGKSTTLLMVAGLEEPESGLVKIGDRVVNYLPPQKRDVAMVFQSYALYPHLSVAQNVEFGLRYRNHSKKTRGVLVDDICTRLGIGDVLTRLPEELSGGQRQRVAVARAIVRRPQAYLLDEPLSNVDAQLRSLLRRELKELHREFGGTFLYVTHDQAEAMSLGDRIAIMRNGEILQVGTPEEVYHEPQNTFVAGFLGSPPMNLLSASVEADGENKVVVVGSWRIPADGIAADIAGQELLFGVRPEDVRLNDQRNESEAIGNSIVRMSEYLGSEQIVVVSEESQQDLTARSDSPRRIRPEETVSVGTVGGRRYLYRADTGGLLAIW